MNKRNLLLVLLGVGVAAIAVLCWWLRSSSLLRVPQAPVTAETPVASPTSTPSSVAQAVPTGRQMPGGAYEPSDPRWKDVHAKDLVDQAWEWRMPINFFGRVLDENEQPVPGAKVELSWTNLSQAGSSEAQTTTDAQGFFSLLNRTGRQRENGFRFPARILDSEGPVSSRGVESVTGYNSCSRNMKQSRSLSNGGREKADRTRNRQQLHNPGVGVDRLNIQGCAIVA
jgi:hypothetical protein